MKSFISRILVAVFLLTAASIPALAEIKSGSCGEHVTYTFDTASGLLTLEGTGAMGNYGYSTPSVPWYSYRTSITRALIKDGVTTIGTFAFSGCSSLTSVAMANSITTIEGDAFRSCTSLNDITFSQSLTTISDHAFHGCSALTTLTLPPSATTIGDNAFYYCTGLTSIDLSSVRSLGKNAFDSCIGLKSVTIPSTLTSISDYAFTGCAHMTSLTISEGVTHIGALAFSACSNLKSVTIPSSVTSIGKSAFYGCTNLSVVVIPKSITSIAERVFYGCTYMTSLTIPSSVSSIASDAFTGCNNIKDVFFDITGIEAWCRNTINGQIGAGHHHLLLDGKELTEVAVPSSVTGIADRAFSHCDVLTSVTLPGSVKSIGDAAFSNCSGLTSVTLPGSVSTIGSEAFSQSGLTSITIPGSVSSIGSKAFLGCRLTTVVSQAVRPDGFKGGFADVVFLHTPLYVPEGTYWRYVFDSEWGRFAQIKEYVASPDEIAENKAYMIADGSGHNYQVYDRQSARVKTVRYSFGVEEDDAAACWQVERTADSRCYLYNVGARRYAAMDKSGRLMLTDTPVAMDMTSTPDGLTLNGNSCLLVLNSQVSVEDGIQSPASRAVDVPIYDLQGRRLNRMQKGLNIVGGKKVMGE